MAHDRDDHGHDDDHGNATTTITTIATTAVTQACTIAAATKAGTSAAAMCRWNIAAGRYVVTDWHREHLREPPRGYHWVRSDNGDFLLVAVATGVIADLLLHH